MASALSVVCAGAQTPGTIDVTYGNNGIARATNGSEYDIASGMAIQKDGKTIVAGSSLSDFMLARFTTDGYPDSSFGTNGVVVTDINNNSVEQANAVIVQSDGKILVAGNTLDGTKRNFALLRYNQDGTLDNSFSGDGKAISTLSFGQDEVMALALQPDGKILAAGYSEGNFAVVRYHQNGTPDNSFSDDGAQITNIDAGAAAATSVHVLKDGSIMLAGFIDKNGQPDCVLAKYKSNGMPDSSFGVNGKTVADLGAIDRIYCSALQADEKIVVAGTIRTGNFNFVVARFNTKGELDTTFSDDGKLAVSFGTYHNSKAESVALQPDGKILLAGSSGITGHYYYALLRLDSMGAPDNSFGNGGKVLGDLGSSIVSEAHGIAVLPDGKIIAGGYSNGDFVCIRYFSGLKLGISEVLQNAGAQAYPNPVSNTANITFTVAESALISIVITDLQGRVVYVPAASRNYPAGRHSEVITLRESLPAGIYFLHINSAQQQQFIKLIKQ